MDSPHDPPVVVVVAEDETLVRELAADALRDEGWVVIEAGHASAALAICKARTVGIDVLFTDVRMPGAMDGVELARCVHERWPGISIVIASGNLVVPAHDLPEGTRLLSKPYDLRHVVDLIRELRGLQ